MNRIIRKLMSWFYRPILERYLRKDRPFRYDGLELIILQSVFHPAFFGSSKVFAGFLKQQHLAGKKLLEVGCGSGLLSLVAAKAGAGVTAVDINPTAIACSRANAQNNHLRIEVVHSDIFQNLKEEDFDFIIVNPPFFEGPAWEDSSYAWYCGTDFYFFDTFFRDLPNYSGAHSKVWMILSEVCDLNPIRAIAAEHNYQMPIIYTETRLFEEFIIFEIQAVNAAG